MVGIPYVHASPSSVWTEWVLGIVVPSKCEMPACFPLRHAGEATDEDHTSCSARGCDMWCRCEELSTTEYRNDVLILAGDVTDDLPTLRRTLQLFEQRWAHVFFTPGELSSSACSFTR